jgi:hypothetical protein
VIFEQKAGFMGLLEDFLQNTVFSMIWERGLVGGKRGKCWRI